MDNTRKKGVNTGKRSRYFYFFRACRVYFVPLIFVDAAAFFAQFLYRFGRFSFFVSLHIMFFSFFCFFFAIPYFYDVGVSFITAEAILG